MRIIYIGFTLVVMVIVAFGSTQDNAQQGDSQQTLLQRHGLSR